MKEITRQLESEFNWMLRNHAEAKSMYSVLKSRAKQGNGEWLRAGMVVYCTGIPGIPYRVMYDFESERLSIPGLDLNTYCAIKDLRYRIDRLVESLRD